MIIIGPNRDKELGIDAEKMNDRATKLVKSIGDEFQHIAQCVAEGHGMVEGTNFATGADLAIFLDEYLTFGVAALMEKGIISKKLMGKSTKAKDEPSTGQYL